MYKITCDGLPVLDFRDESYIVLDPKLHLEVNTVGEASFLIYNDHPNYSKLQKMKSIFEISDEIGVLFRGRTTKDTVNFDLGKAVDLEGLMAFFNDTLVAPFSFPADFEDDAGYTSADNVIKFFLAWLLENHNSQVPDFQKFKLGNVTVSDPNNYLFRESEEVLTTWEVLSGKLFETALGGYLSVRYEEDGNYIDYLADFELTNTQTIEYGANLLDLSNVSEALDTYSAIVPFGAEIENADGTRTRLTLESVTDREVTQDIYKKTLPNGLHAVYSETAVENYGWVCAYMTWDDVTTVQALGDKTIETLMGSSVKLTDTIEIKAVDLHFSDAEIRSFRVGRYVNAISAPHGLNDRYKLTMLDIDLLNPQNTEIVLGETRKTLTDRNYDKFQNAEVKIESTKNELKDVVSTVEEKIAGIENVDSDLEQIRTTITENYTSLLNTSEEIILNALSSYTETGDFESFKEAVSAELKLLSDNMTLKFTEATSAIENVNNDLQEKFNTITKYFTFDINGLTIGQVDNPYKVIIDNNRYSMTVHDVEVMWIADGKVYTPEIEVTKGFKLLGYLIEKDAHDNVNCSYVGGES